MRQLPTQPATTTLREIFDLTKIPTKSLKSYTDKQKQIEIEKLIEMLTNSTETLLGN